MTSIKGQRSNIFFLNFFQNKAHKHFPQAFLIPNIYNMSIFEKYLTPKKFSGKKICENNAKYGTFHVSSFFYEMIEIDTRSFYFIFICKKG